jgi:NTP pyrophosphatase (non-canonical NTP hydrolase)
MAQTYNQYSLPQFQQLIKELSGKRGFDKELLSQKFMLLLEETGEFAKAARKLSGISVDENSKKHLVEEEAADVFWVLIDLCNSLDIDLADAFKDKEAKNKERSWN